MILTYKKLIQKQLNNKSKINVKNKIIKESFYNAEVHPPSITNACPVI